MRLTNGACSFCQNVRHHSLARPTLEAASCSLRRVAGIRFVPLDIIGLLACQVPWRDDFSLDLSLPPQRVDVLIDWGLHRNKDKTKFALSLAAITADIKLAPAPLALLMESFDFTIPVFPSRASCRQSAFHSAHSCPKLLVRRCVSP
jgi:hypothetical protein